MPLNQKDVLKLETWSFLRDYGKHRVGLIELAREAYEGTEFLRGGRPTQDSCVALYMAMLMNTEIFRGMVARKRHLPPIFYESMCLALAKYVLHTDWRWIAPTD